jgi:probable 2-oxoglutarate dehydrogenase E1 component DHKTD1
VQQFRVHGHRAAELDPLGLLPKEYFLFLFIRDIYQLNPLRFGLSENSRYKLSGILHVGKSSDPSISRDEASLDRILSHLKKTYTG